VKVSVLRNQLGYRVRSQDGQPHITYYDAEHQYSFVWDGHVDHPIEVEHGGYGEVLVALIQLGEEDAPPEGTRLPDAWLFWFALVCQQALPQLLAEWEDPWN